VLGLKPRIDVDAFNNFMKKIGLDYPIDDRGIPQGETFRFRWSAQAST
jgi:hypothetical protein